MGVVTVLAATLLACSWGGEEDDDCDDDESMQRPASGWFYSGDVAAVTHNESQQALPASGGFGTHLSSCGS